MLDNDADQDFLNQMHLAVLEECPLHEAPQGSVDLLAAGPVTHGPWPADQVAAVLRAWNDAGWITLYFRELPPSWDLTPAEWQQRLLPDRTLHPADAAHLLNQPHRWTIDRADGHVALCRTDLGDTIDYQQWIDSARRSKIDSLDEESQAPRHRTPSSGQDPTDPHGQTKQP
jgi:hypothetical protein